MAWAPDYITAAQLKAYLRITDTDDDAQMALAVTAASRAIDHHCNRQFGLTGSAVERFYRPWWDRFEGVYRVTIDDLMTATGLEVASRIEADGTYSDLAGEAYEVGPANAAADGRPWTEVTFARGVVINLRERGVRVTANYGWTAVPDTIEQAALLQASRFFHRRTSPYGVAGSPDAGSEMRLLQRVDPDVAVALGNYRRGWGAA